MKGMKPESRLHIDEAGLHVKGGESHKGSRSLPFHVLGSGRRQMRLSEHGLPGGRYSAGKVAARLCCRSCCSATEIVVVDDGKGTPSSATSIVRKCRPSPKTAPMAAARSHACYRDQRRALKVQQRRAPDSWIGRILRAFFVRFAGPANGVCAAPARKEERLLTYPTILFTPCV
jgi:hypothetical protein